MNDLLRERIFYIYLLQMSHAYVLYFSDFSSLILSLDFPFCPRFCKILKLFKYSYQLTSVSTKILTTKQHYQTITSNNHLLVTGGSPRRCSRAWGKCWLRGTPGSPHPDPGGAEKEHTPGPGKAAGDLRRDEDSPFPEHNE